ncbi:MAG TPA: hypothetical protein DCQ96_05585, partial [Verrucomicrobiales bacterium]|nr:hypothetical protein [Verrucomicrobiales bacterium]
MNQKLLQKARLLLLTTSILSFASPVFAGEKLKIFILAGQSNTVGHANQHTLATLYRPGDERDKKLTQLVFKADSGLSPEALEEQLERARKIDELTGGISNDKIKAMSDGPKKTAVEAELKKLNEA